MISLIALGLVGAAYYLISQNKPAAPSPGSVAPPAAPIRSGNQVANGRTYFVEVFAGGIARITGQAVQLTVKLNPATKTFVVVSADANSNPAALAELKRVIPQLKF